MEAMTQAVRSNNITVQQQQQQEALLRTATTGQGQNVQIERVVGVLIDRVRVFSDRSRVNFVDVRGVGKPSLPERSVNVQRVGQEDQILSDWHGTTS